MKALAGLSLDCLVVTAMPLAWETSFSKRYRASVMIFSAHWQHLHISLGLESGTYKGTSIGKFRLIRNSMGAETGLNFTSPEESEATAAEVAAASGEEAST